MSLAVTNIARVGAIVGGCNAAGYLLTAVLETHKLTDLVGAGSFVAATLALSHHNGLLKFDHVSHPKLLLVNVGVMLWGSRLASYLFSRVLKVGEDKRLNKFFRKPGEAYLDIKASFFPVRLATFWTIQAAWGFLCLLPVTLLNSVPLLKNGFPNPALSFASGGGALRTGMIDWCGFSNSACHLLTIFTLQLCPSCPWPVSSWALVSRPWLTGRRTRTGRTRRTPATGAMWVSGRQVGIRTVSFFKKIHNNL